MLCLLMVGLLAMVMVIKKIRVGDEIKGLELGKDGKDMI